MSSFGKLSGLLKKKEEKKEELPKQKPQAPETPTDEVDREAISKIVERMKSKYVKEGVMKGEEEERSRIRMMMSGEREKIGVEVSAKELALYESPIVRLLGKFYLAFESPISALTRVARSKMGRALELDLLASGMRYSVEQYISLCLAAGILTGIITIIMAAVFVAANKLSLLYGILAVIIVPLVIMFVAFTMPNSKAKKIGSRIDKELPFALRHMSIEIRAGVGIYKTMDSIATSGYGPLSDGFKWVLSQIEKGVPTEEALEAWAERTKSESVNRVVSHLVRALRTGGNLSEVMITIADDVSFERRTKIADFAEKMNLLGLFLMMFTVVFPVMITILTTIASSPSISQYLGLFSFFTPTFLMLVYFVVVPSVVGLFIYYIRSSDPG
ncbi:type II secretion system F family protein [Candidatus Micrarchaeota archaeon]|nr:type II secretion system F family protein [Candidatus Micrarchaeota archaeon]